jgi:hypothetical protein
MGIQDVQKYLAGPFRDIDGWCIPHLWQAIQPLHQAMVGDGVAAPIAEIGVYQGKFFIGLLKTMNAPLDNYAIDVFGLQRFNLDGSGRGDLDRLKANLERAGVDASAVRLWQTDSMSIDEAMIGRLRETIGGFSFFSVDGCHMVEHTINDMELAIRLTLPSGIIFVDDYYNANWPGVQEGVSRFYLTRTPRFVPLLFTCNKLFLCHISFHREYLKIVEGFVRANFPETRLKRVQRFGYDGLTLTPKITGEEYLKL